MKKETLLKKLEACIEKIEDQIENISTLLEIDSDDDELAEMSVLFREKLDEALVENDECNINDIYEYIKENL